jgi:hypothetical protein
MDIVLLTTVEVGCAHDRRELRRIPRGWDYAGETAHTFRPTRLAGG